MNLKNRLARLERAAGKTTPGHLQAVEIWVPAQEGAGHVLDTVFTYNPTTRQFDKTFERSGDDGKH